MSSGVPSFFMGMEAARASMYSWPMPSMPSVRMLPGITALMVTPSWATSMAALRMKPSIAALVAP